MSATRPHRRVTTIIVLLGALVSLAGCISPASVPVATDAVFPPFHFVDDRGRLTGYDLETIREALDRVGARAEIARGESFSALFDGLEHGDHDIVAATTGITPERMQRFAFSRPYFVTCLGVMVREGPGEPRSLDDLAGRRVTASQGTTSERAARNLPGAIVVTRTSARAMLDALKADEVDAIVIDEFEAVEFSRADPAFTVLDEPAALESYGFMLRQDDIDLLTSLNFALEAMERDGTLARLQEQFGIRRTADWPIRMP